VLIAAVAVAGVLSAPSTALGQSATISDLTDAGKAVFKRANCFGCHKWHGNGGGGYGGDALSLRKTELTRGSLKRSAAGGPARACRSSLVVLTTPSNAMT
jgi:mono/diheme cytochrome c family protein